MKLKSIIIILMVFIISALFIIYFVSFKEVEIIDCGYNQSCAINAFSDCSKAKGTFKKEAVASEYELTDEDFYYIAVNGQKILINLSEKSKEYDEREFEIIFNVKEKTETGCLVKFILDEKEVVCNLPFGILEPEQFEDILLSSYMQRCSAQ